MSGIKRPIYVNPEFINKYGLPQNNGEDVKFPIVASPSSTSWVPESYVALNTPTTTPEMDAILKAYVSGVPATKPTTPTNNITASNVVNVPKTVGSKEEKPSSTPSKVETPFTLGDSSEVGKIEAAYGNTVTAINNNLARTEADIEKQRQEAIRNAYSVYDKSLSTYGRKAEQLAAMGLGNSGYSDYLSGVAYGNMVGGIQDANEGADEAIRNAYADADQLKLNAEAKKNADIAAAQEKHRDDMINLLTNVGNVDSSIAEAIARSYGFSDDEVNYIKSVYGEHEKTEAVNQLDFYKTHGYLVDASGNEYVPTESEIEKLGVKAAYGEEQIAEVKTELKAEIDNEVYERYAQQLQAEVASGEARGTLTELDEKYAKKEISEETYQHIYYDRALAFVENATTADEIDEELRYINSLESTGKLSEQDAKSLREYAESRRVVQISEKAPVVYSKEEGRNGRNATPDKITITFDNEEVNISGTENATKQARDAISKVVPSPKEGDMVKYDGNVYIYFVDRNGSGWDKVPSLNEIFDKYAGLYNKATKPKHTPIKE